MENINDPYNIMGMAEILANDDEDLDFEDLEKSIIKGVEFKKKDVHTPEKLEKEYEQEADSLFKQFNLVSDQRSNSRDNDDESPLDWGPYNNPSKNSSFKSKSFDQFNKDSEKSNKNIQIKTSSETDSESEGSEDSNDSDTDNSKEWSPSNPNDPRLIQMTSEERRQNHINKVLGKIEKTEDDGTFVQEEEEEEEIAKIMEQIDLLRTNLESESIDLHRIPEVTIHTSKKEARSILRMLQIKNDRLRYCDMFEEGILSVAYALESYFDGNNEIFGTKIDLVGLPDTIQIKLMRMRVNTSSFIGDVMKGYNIGHGWRILLELLPVIFLYSRDRRTKTGDNLISDDKYKDALREMQNK